ncbi:MULTISPECIES: NtaA/DmoA family FMN-dependent monooxygenase [Actinomycetes]|uniref:NtaA/DmoA family FMN-dependent monooxygenase n=1 Tax=Actinomycetes TaxID=1760 RepID=UPI00041D4EDA|nr:MULTISPECIES: NtaA/DmoA family FMN-dependent monooxygenase [Actinomycetes]MDN5586470.1 NtaA/DmoA family FMN-dependent monooxygenase [Brevibacterium sp.]MDN5604490.1 NtaA/DmoA family FMN-dependent monooxygenase [Kocuria sp.]MDN5909300.1 NtaA/DmoA family FMN-dependent monooxygenase [Brevibacterium sp.]MDN6720158.1 NtaA/DmoA family FMN-dependent monooxygenase [Bifidobacterium mongoliense]RCS74897.1 LLM class flavin-dependent oxidoreductase [Brachybacterium alimentarium]
MTASARTQGPIASMVLYPTSLMLDHSGNEREASRRGDLGYHRELVSILEAGLFDGLFAADFLAQPQPVGGFLPEPVTLLSGLAGSTSRLGLVGSLSTTYNEPYAVARAIASLDHLSNGRAGWNMVTSPFEATAGLYGRAPMPHDERYARATEFAEVVEQLWDSWDGGNRIDAVRYHGAHVDVDGALNIPRTPQGRPVRFSAGVSVPGRAFAARFADAVYIGHGTPAEVNAIARDIKTQAVALGRAPGDIRVMASQTVAVRDDADEAAALLGTVSPEQRLDGLRAQLASLGGTGAVPEGLDIPLRSSDFPRKTSEQGMAGWAQRLLDEIHATAPTLRQLTEKETTVAYGPPEVVADKLESYLVDGGIDGFVLSTPLNLAEAENLVDTLVPELQRRALHRTAYTGATLREHLGLQPPLSPPAVETKNHTLTQHTEAGA